jgi:hypothetical protein
VPPSLDLLVDVLAAETSSGPAPLAGAKPDASSGVAAGEALESTQTIMVGDWMCPVVSPLGAVPCRDSTSAVSATRLTRVEPFVDNQFDFLAQDVVISPAHMAMDPMLVEVAIERPLTDRRFVSEPDHVAVTTTGLVDTP